MEASGWQLQFVMLMHMAQALLRCRAECTRFGQNPNNYFPNRTPNPPNNSKIPLSSFNAPYRRNRTSFRSTVTPHRYYEASIALYRQLQCPLSLATLSVPDGTWRSIAIPSASIEKSLLASFSQISNPPKMHSRFPDWQLMFGNEGSCESLRTLVCRDRL